MRFLIGQQGLNDNSKSRWGEIHPVNPRWSLEKYRDDDHQEDAPHFIISDIINILSPVPRLAIRKYLAL